MTFKCRKKHKPVNEVCFNICYHANSKIILNVKLLKVTLHDTMDPKLTFTIVLLHDFTKPVNEINLF